MRLRTGAGTHLPSVRQHYFLMCRTMLLLKLYYFTRSKEFPHNYENWGLLFAGQGIYQRQERSNGTYNA